MRVRLQDVADIITGVSTSGRSIAGQGTQQVTMIRSKDLERGALARGETDSVKVKDLEKIDRYRVIKNDVILARRGNVHSRPVLVPAELEGSIISVNLVAIRIRDERLKPELLQGYLDRGNPGHQRLLSLAQGMTMSMIRTKDLKNLAVPVPSMDVQRSLARLIRKSQRYKALLRKQDKMWDDIIRQTIRNEMTESNPDDHKGASTHGK